MNKIIEFGLLSIAGVFGASIVFMLAWLPAILCVAVGHGPEVCGL